MRIYSPSPIDQINRWPWWWWRCRLLSDDQAVSEFPYRLLVSVVVRCARNNRWSIECGWLYASKCREFTIIQFEIVKNCFDNEETSSFLLVVVITFPLFILSFYIILKYMCLCLCLSILYPDLGFKFVLYYFYNNTNVYFLHPVAKLNWKSFSQNINCIRCQIVFKCVPLHHTPLLPFRTAKDAKGQMSVSPAKIKKTLSQHRQHRKTCFCASMAMHNDISENIFPGTKRRDICAGTERCYRSPAATFATKGVAIAILSVFVFQMSVVRYGMRCDLCTADTHTAHGAGAGRTFSWFSTSNPVASGAHYAIVCAVGCNLLHYTGTSSGHSAVTSGNQPPVVSAAKWAKKRPTNASMFSQMSHHWHITRF